MFYILYYIYSTGVKLGFFKGGEGGHTVLNRRYSTDCHVNIHGMFYLKEGLQRESWAYRTPLTPQLWPFSKGLPRLSLLVVPLFQLQTYC